MDRLCKAREVRWFWTKCLKSRVARSGPVWWEERECGAGAGLWAGSVLSAGLAWPPQAVSSLCTFGTRAAGVVGLMLRSSELWNEDSFARCQPEVGLTFPDGIS